MTLDSLCFPYVLNLVNLLIVQSRGPQRAQRKTRKTLQKLFMFKYFATFQERD